MVAKIQADPNLVERLQKAGDQAEFFRIAREAGFDLREDTTLQGLDEDELEEVAGGARGGGPVRSVDWCRLISGPTCTYIDSTNRVGTPC